MPGSHLNDFLVSLGLTEITPTNAAGLDFWARRGGGRVGITIRNRPFTGYEAMDLSMRARDGGWSPLVIPRAGVRGDVASWATRLGLEVVPEARLHAFEAAVSAEEALLAEERLTALEALQDAYAEADLATATHVDLARVEQELVLDIAGELGGAVRAAAALAEATTPPPAAAPPEPLAAEPAVPDVTFTPSLEAAEALTAALTPPAPPEVAPEPAVADDGAPDLPWNARPRAPAEARLDTKGLPWDDAFLHEQAQAMAATRALSDVRSGARTLPWADAGRTAEDRVAMSDPEVWGTKDRLTGIRDRLNKANVDLSVKGASDWLEALEDEDA